ncbi:bifunctional tRNA (5-methylaminomethyl-2-thiouridine)(34)-methyltransferase MnmD/FAD-dependent 5-carboxymethylaminomethyl-2-thiouridine(34) oxidoreductase MnmC [Candidatus Nitrotoga sp. 1052]|uniref:bifunctional tRNA (5-methylaminomethyl-2-thiouridine)(34)-methyltransferase MnmD/FAD-dependent 5-carboxymethylaminomethyl-2-thiouridine(34) oxidoreductase MnmC n=1 Tax=Candidatus Nitrotoga sp. 1052 TaxID=2886964 RepID=UPI001EF71235|nr:bifunctional tRNA (5-methylaminomethyl-2-thiouridine)(34)-methyltransferase MnmD/FAD-dependent 5-carboxymethylaminomethyl-2-thiouridine(34) oxidoreductase MnmC [Candidatus Nitrotoga sp. 1052]CAH1086199.1 tRNA (mnm(5)s(2)U34)-methyltransferase / FAD-dependent cmnm(5)s(2)U34 oxidoreductase [Candidatus Nitrotoga sp. 1052]
MLDWQDGQPFSSRFSDVYFSNDSGLEEKRHVFLQGNRLAERFASLSSGDSFAIGETGFGTGLNFLCAWQLFDKVASSNSSLDFFSVEKYPFDERELADVLALWPVLRQYADELLARWRRRVPGWNRWSFAGGKIRLTLVIGDVVDALTEICGGIDAWFLDGFSPARNPEMWTQSVFESVVRISQPGASFATYTCAGWVRRGLEQAGFQVSKSPGFGRKREMLQGHLPGSPPVRAKVTKVIVIGGGVAGCAVASALAMRGVSVTLIESAPALAAAASGNPRGILHIRLSAGMDSLQRFLLASYGHALALLDEKLPIDGIARAECGELQLAFSAQEAKRIDRLAALDWPAHVLRRVDAAEASELTGIELAHGGLWFPAGGWLVPPQMCEALAASPAIVRRTGYRAESLAAVESGWRVEGKDERQQAWSDEAQVVVVCTGYQVKSFAPLSHLPLTPVRGQITMLPATPHSENLRTIVSANGYLAPSDGELHVLGATHDFNDEAVDLRASDHAENLSKLADISPTLAKSMNIDSLDVEQLNGRASVRASVPGAMPLVGELLPGLYTSLGHGTRGLITAGLSGELIAAMACGQLPPLPLAVVNALAPVPWLVRLASD